MTKRKQMKEYHDQFVEMAKTHTLPQIYNNLGLSPSSVSRYFEKNSIKCIENRNDISEFHDEIVKLVSKNYNLKEIADKLTIDSNSLRSYCITNNVKILKIRKGDLKLIPTNNTENKYYVYGHYLADGTLFYIGKGTRGRMSNKNNRSERWLNFTNGIEWYPEVIIGDLSNNDATTIESDLIRNTPNLINTVKSSAELELFGFESVFYYDESSPTGLRWKVWNKQTNHCKRLPGDIAGIKITVKGKDQGYKVGYSGKEYKVHRVIMYLHGVDCNNKVVDHIDGNPNNNYISNLRAISQSKNCRNNKLRVDSQTGINGVILVKYKGTLHYRSTVALLDLFKSRVFSIKKYGLIPAFYKACEWRKEQIRLLNEQGAGYTERHGT